MHFNYTTKSLTLGSYVQLLRFHKVAACCCILVIFLAVFSCSLVGVLSDGMSPAWANNQSSASSTLVCDKSDDNHVHTADCFQVNTDSGKDFSLSDNRADAFDFDRGDSRLLPGVFDVMAADAGSGETSTIRITSEITTPTSEYWWSSFLYDFDNNKKRNLVYNGTIYIKPDESIGLKAGDTIATTGGGSVVVGQETSFIHSYYSAFELFNVPVGAEYTIKQTSVTPYDCLATVRATVDGVLVGSSDNEEYQGVVALSSQNYNVVTIKNVPSASFAVQNSLSNPNNVEVATQVAQEYTLKMYLKDYNQHNPIIFTLYDKAGQIKETKTVSYREGEEFTALTFTLDEGERIQTDTIMLGTNMTLEKSESSAIPGITTSTLIQYMSDDYPADRLYEFGEMFSVGEPQMAFVVNNERVDATYTLSKVLGYQDPDQDLDIGPIVPPTPPEPPEGGFGGDGGDGGDGGIDTGDGGGGADGNNGGAASTTEEFFQNAQRTNTFTFVVNIEPDGAYLKPGDVVKAQVYKRYKDQLYGVDLREQTLEYNIVVGQDNNIELGVYSDARMFEIFEIPQLPVGAKITAAEILSPHYEAEANGADESEVLNDRLVTRKTLTSGNEGYYWGMAKPNTVVFHNIPTQHELTITKVVTGDIANPNDRFNIYLKTQGASTAVRLLDKDGNPIDGTLPENEGMVSGLSEYLNDYENLYVDEQGYVYVYANYSEVRFKLRDGDKAVCGELSYGSPLVVREDGYDSYRTTITDSSLDAPALPSNELSTVVDSDKTITVTNEVIGMTAPDVRPPTGHENSSSFPLVGLILFCFGVAGSFLFRMRDRLTAFDKER